MGAPLLRLLGTDAKRWSFWFVLVFWALQLAAFSVAQGHSRGAADMLPMVLLAVGYTCAGIGVWAKEHLGAYRARTIPGFRGMHLAVTAGYLAVAMLPFAVATHLSGGKVLGLLAIVSLIGALAFAGSTRGGWRAIALSLACVGAFTPPVSQRVTALVAGDYPGPALAAVLLGLWLLGDTFVFLATMDEETPGYEHQFRTNLRRFRGYQARQSMSAAMRHLDRQNSIWLRLVDAHLPAVMPTVVHSRWRRLVHWQRAYANGWLGVLAPTIVWGLMVTVQLGLGSHSSTPGPSILRSTLWVLVGMPSFLGLNVWQVRGGMFSREMTYPLRRRDFLLEQGAVILFSQYAAWLLLLAAMAAALAVMSGTMPWADLLTLAAVAGPWQAMAFALLARLGTLGSGLPMAVCLTLAAALGTLLLLGCLALGNPATTATVAAGLTLVAAASLAGVYRHWLKVDIP